MKRLLQNPDAPCVVSCAEAQKSLSVMVRGVVPSGTAMPTASRAEEWQLGWHTFNPIRGMRRGNGHCGITLARMLLEGVVNAITSASGCRFVYRIPRNGLRTSTARKGLVRRRSSGPVSHPPGWELESSASTLTAISPSWLCSLSTSDRAGTPRRTRESLISSSMLSSTLLCL